MEDFEPVSGEEFVRLKQILDANKDKSFVQRILRPNDFPSIPYGDGYTATHQMEHSESNGKYYVYPRILLQKDGTLKDYGDDAWDQVRQSGNFIEFSNPAEAEWFSKRYKGAWGGQMNKPPR